MRALPFETLIGNAACARYMSVALDITHPPEPVTEWPGPMQGGGGAFYAGI